jgi:DNA mismatch repair protein MutS
MQQWRQIKARHRDAIVFFRVGDFYEMFNEDAEEGARLLDLTLTSRNNGSSRAPLAGIPVHAVDVYLERLVKLGRRVAVCEQVEDPSQAKGIVRREVVETVTPGVLLSDTLLQARRNNFLVALAGDPARDLPLGLASADLSTGELTLQSVPWGQLRSVLSRVQPAELLLPTSWGLFTLELDPEPVTTYRSDAIFDQANAAEELKRCYGVLNLEGFGIGEHDPALVSAAGALVSYLVEVQPRLGSFLRPPMVERDRSYMVLDEMTCRNLELVEPLRNGGTTGTLLAVLDQALTPMGGRLLRRWLLAPLVEQGGIVARQQAVAELVADSDARRAVREALSEFGDLERLAVKVAAGRIGPRELLGLAHSLLEVPRLQQVLASSAAPLLVLQRDELDPLEGLRAMISDALDAAAPSTLAEGGYIRSGYNTELDQLRATRDGAVEWIARLQARERERSGIGSLKVGFNKVFGYYLEVTRSNLSRVPDDYHRKQTLANCERYVTPELKDWEEKVLGAEEKIAALEASLFAEIRSRAAMEVAGLQRLAERIATIDVLAGLAEAAVRGNFVRPEIDSDLAVHIRGGRHPVVETMMPAADFIPNDISLDQDRRVIILTGPNMAGKSTVLRQVGLIVLMAQIGSFVPAREAKLGVLDRIFTRVGASDNLVRGQSTFMVEMNETASILHSATARSLVLLDEIGRGTSTWDGLSVATAVTEHLHDRIGAKTIFATHYHELTGLAETLPAVVNFSVAVREEGEKILFLRRLVPGGADRSYGVEVARLAGLPATVVSRARQLLRELEGTAAPGAQIARRPDAPAPVQLPLFDPPPHPVLERLRELDPNEMTPLQALNLLAELITLIRR